MTNCVIHQPNGLYCYFSGDVFGCNGRHFAFYNVSGPFMLEWLEENIGDTAEKEMQEAREQKHRFEEALEVIRYTHGPIEADSYRASMSAPLDQQPQEHSVTALIDLYEHHINDLQSKNADEHRMIDFYKKRLGYLKTLNHNRPQPDTR